MEPEIVTSLWRQQTTNDVISYYCAMFYGRISGPVNGYHIRNVGHGRLPLVTQRMISLLEISVSGRPTAQEKAR